MTIIKCYFYFLFIFLLDAQDEIWQNKECDLNDLALGFQDDYEYYGWRIKTNILQINFAGTSDWFYFFSIPNDKLDSYKENIDEYPVYYVDLELGHLEKNQ